MSSPGKVLRVDRLRNMLHRLCEPPSITLSFSLAAVVPGGVLNTLTPAVRPSEAPLRSTHRLQPGLPGYLIPFATLAFVPQRQLQTRKLPSPLAFLPISTHFTATPEIPLSPSALKPNSFRCSSPGEPGDFTPNTFDRLRTLYAQ